MTVTTGPLVLINSLDPAPNYGFGLEASCWDYVPSGDLFTTAPKCWSVNAAATNTFLHNASISFAVLSNISSTTTVATLDSEPPFAYMVLPGNRDMAVTDYTATTYGMQTQCEPVSRKCNLVPFSGAQTYYYCTDAFNGVYKMNDNGGELDLPHFENAALTNITDQVGDGIRNPYYFGQVTGFTALQYETSDPEIVTPMHGGMAFILACNATLFDVEYDVVNSTVTRFVTQRSNDTLAQLAAAPMAGGEAAKPILQQSAIAAALANDTKQTAKMMALAYSKATLAVFAQMTVPKPALQAQRRTEMLVAKVPVAALYAQVVADLLYVLVGLVLSIVALVGSRAEDARELQARLGVEAVVAGLFEADKSRQPVRGVSELFEENDGKTSRRVCIVKTAEGGRCYEAITTGIEEETSGDGMEMNLLPRASMALGMSRDTGSP